MGQGKSKYNNSQLFDPAEFKEGNKHNNERYGSVKLYTHIASRQQFALLEKSLNDEKEFEQTAHSLDFRKELIHPSIIQLVAYNSVKEDEFCSSFFKLSLFCEYFENNLRTEISERQRCNVAYREGELWYILDTLLNAVAYLNSKGVNHGDIRPFNVVITPEGEVKLGEVFMYIKSISSYSQLLNQQHNEFYISPQLVKAYKASTYSHNPFNPEYDAFKSDVFSIGMTILEAATLENVSRVCYDLESETVNIKTDEVNRLLNQVRLQHSFQLYSFIQKLLIEDEIARPSINELLLEISQYQNQKTSSLSTVEIINQHQVLNQDVQEVYQEEHVVRSANPARQSYTQEKAYEVTYTTPVANYDNDDLNARIQAVLAMSRETIAKYGSSSVNYTAPATNYTAPATNYTAPATNYVAPATYTTTTYTTTAVPATTTYTYTAPIDAKASQIETRTFLNENTNNIETKNYQQEAADEVVKRSKKETAPEVPAPQANVYQSNTYVPQQTNTYVPQTTYTTTTYNGNVEPVRNSQFQNITYNTSAPVQYNFTSTQQPEAANNTYVSSSYTPYTQKVQETNFVTTVPASSVPAQQVTEYQTTSQFQFQNPKDLDAYINKLISDSKSYGAANNTNTTITYTNYVDNKPVETVQTYGNNQPVQY